jgi:hypothetical protein
MISEESLYLKRDPSAYYYLKRSGCYRVDTIDDNRDFKIVQVRFYFDLFDLFLQRERYFDSYSKFVCVCVGFVEGFVVS